MILNPNLHTKYLLSRTTHKSSNDLMRIHPQREKPLGHRLQMPNPLTLDPKHFLPLALQLSRQLPSQFRVANAHAH